MKLSIYETVLLTKKASYGIWPQIARFTLKEAQSDSSKSYGFRQHRTKLLPGACQHIFI